MAKKKKTATSNELPKAPVQRCSFGHVSCENNSLRCAAALKKYFASKCGRPSEWHESHNEALKTFFEVSAFDTHLDSHGRPHMLAMDCPTIEGFASIIGVHVDTLNEWAKPANTQKYPGFSEAFHYAKQKQKELLIRCGIANAGNSQFIQFILKNNHGMKDTTDLTNNGGAFEAPPMYDASGAPYGFGK